MRYSRLVEARQSPRSNTKSGSLANIQENTSHVIRKWQLLLGVSNGTYERVISLTSMTCILYSVSATRPSVHTQIEPPLPNLPLHLRQHAAQITKDPCQGSPPALAGRPSRHELSRCAIGSRDSAFLSLDAFLTIRPCTEARLPTSSAHFPRNHQQHRELAPFRYSGVDQCCCHWKSFVCSHPLRECYPRVVSLGVFA